MIANPASCWTQSKNNVQDAATPQGHPEPAGQSALSIDTIRADEKKSISNADCALPNVVTPTSIAEVKLAEEQEYARTHSNIYVQDTATSPGNLDDSEYEPNERNALSIEISVPHNAPHNITISIETTVRSDPNAKWSVGSPSKGSESAHALRYSTTCGAPAPANNDPAPSPLVTIRVDSPKRARDHTMSATNDKPPPLRKHKSDVSGLS